MKFTTDIEILDSHTREEIQAEIDRYTLALEEKLEWDRLSKEEKDDLFMNLDWAWY